MLAFRFLIFSFLSCTLIFGEYASAQDTTQYRVKPTVIELGFGMGGNIPAGDLKNRFGPNLNLSTHLHYISPKDFVMGGGLMFIFGDNVKEDVLAPFRTTTGVILGDDNQIADVFLRQRGLYLSADVGKLFPVSKKSRSGIMVMASGGILQHNIRFTDERNSVAQIRAGRSVGYDRLTRGFGLRQSIGYKHMSRDKRVNFEVLFDFIQGFTSEIRAVNFDTGLATISSRTDLLFGFRMKWNLPFYFGGKDDIIYY
ncbi:MAG: hypothetical protein WAT22_15825 [Saprospiraceae bacterium]|jgi:hypothetical protein|nr:hypothetical protein [Saprospiraceae bacterium]MBP6445891.1 hypothetical protein [Saprospiraceae bacterium]